MPAGRRTLRLDIEYDGAGFSGWAAQPGLRTVEGELTAALGTLLREPVELTVAGRTDAGVHAAAQVASVRLTAAITPERLVRACNASLPDDVRVLAAEPMPDRFHARIHARGKTYRYFIWHAPAGSPALRRLAWHVPQRLDLAAMQEAAARLVGEHDFAAFQAAGSAVKSTVRRLWTSSVAIEPAPPAWVQPSDRGRLLCFEVSGNGFLRHQVRAMAGTVVLVGKGRLTPDDVSRMLDGGVRADAGPTAPAHGLHLWRVDYPDDDRDS